ncbi:hypothetical protein OROHE_007258 [Orobanche hederae]
MEPSQTSSKLLKKRENIINGRLFTISMVMERVQSETEDLDSMERIISRIKQQGLYRLGSYYSDLSDVRIVEEFYLDASVKLSSFNQGGNVCSITAIVHGIRIYIYCTLLEAMFRLPSDGLKLEDLETFGSQDILTTYWGFVHWKWLG